jgi:hypothetical protein
MFERSILKRSGQWWKALASLGAMGVGLLAFFVGLHLEGETTPLYSLSGLVTLIGLLVGLSGIGFALTSIRCPSCGARWVWLAVSQHSPDGWLGWLLDQSNCPVCAGRGVGRVA